MSVVLITGCSTGGIGFALCEEFAARGCKVYATSRRLESMEGFQSPNITKLVLDVTSDEDVQRIVSHIEEIEKKIDILVNNAGVPGFGALLDQTPEYIQRCFDTNVFAIIRTCKAVVPIMAKRKQGLIMNVGSIVGEVATPWNGLYCASKAAVFSLSEILNMECRPFNIKVTHIAPGGIQSNITTNGLTELPLPETSLFKEYLPDIMRRANASQAGSLGNAEFARRVVDKALGPSPPQYMSLGTNAFTFQIFKWLPRTWVLSYLWKIYSKKK